MEKDRHRAEIFDALGHPTRILILKVLSEGSLGFADLKKKTAIESSGHLQHHLTKLNGLIKTDEYGKYCLSDEGKDALLTVQTVENASSKNNLKEKEHKKHFRSKIGLKPIAFLLVALLCVNSIIALYEFTQTVSLYNETKFLKGINPEATLYYYKFGSITPITFTNASFSPPISMYKALLMGLDDVGWNKTSLKGFDIYVNLVPWETSANYTDTIVGGAPPFNDSQIARIMNSPPANYSAVYSNGIIYRYIWQIDLMKSAPIGSQLWDVIAVDASTGQILDHTIVY